MKTKKEVEKALTIIECNSNLTYGYREDVISVLSWVLGEFESFCGLDGKGD